MEQLKVMTIVGTRPEIIRLSEVMKACDRAFRHILVHTGQNYDEMLSGVFFRELGLREPDYVLDAAADSLGETLGNVVSRSYDVRRRESPDALLILGDTNSALCAIPAKRLKIPIFHMEAGNRCFDENVPEEINRRIVDHISDLNLPYTEYSRRYLLAEGIRGDRIFVTGSPMREVLKRNAAAIEASDVLERLALRAGGYFLASIHREENVDREETLRPLMEALNSIAGHYGLPVVYSTHPRSAKRLEAAGFVFHPLVKSLRPFGYFDYCKLQKNAYCVLSDSGTLSEEAAILGFPAVLLRTSTERPEALDKGVLALGGAKKEELLCAVELTRALGGRAAVPDYGEEAVSAKVTLLIQSYARLLRRLVWGEEPK